MREVRTNGEDGDKRRTRAEIGEKLKEHIEASRGALKEQRAQSKEEKNSSEEMKEGS